MICPSRLCGCIFSLGLMGNGLASIVQADSSCPALCGLSGHPFRAVSQGGAASRPQIV